MTGSARDSGLDADGSVVIGQSERFLYLRKPAGLPVLPPHADPSGDCLVARLLEQEPTQAGDWPRGFAGGVLHRLDVPTSGLVVAARDLEAFAAGRAAFASHQLEKRYLFLTRRSVPWAENTVDVDLAHDRRRRARMVPRRGENSPHRGRWFPARTHLQRFTGEAPPCEKSPVAPSPAAPAASDRASDRGPTLWRATIQTGVTHQVRLHAAFTGLALWGDRLYGGGEGPDHIGFFLHHEQIDGWVESTPKLALPVRWAPYLG